MGEIVKTLASKGLTLLARLVAGKGAEFVEGLSGIKLSPEMDEETLIQLKQYELEHEDELNRLATELEMARLKDLANARERDLAVQRSEKAGFLSKNTPHILAVGTVCLTFILFFLVLFRQINAVNKDIVIYLLGILSAITTQIFNFYFGSSKGSKDKDSNLQALLKQNSRN
ncbi:MAG: hypothetical protein Kow0037_00700 [Calditrichia bacterium]